MYVASIHDLLGVPQNWNFILRKITVTTCQSCCLLSNYISRRPQLKPVDHQHGEHPSLTYEQAAPWHLVRLIQSTIDQATGRFRSRSKSSLTTNLQGPSSNGLSMKALIREWPPATSSLVMGILIQLESRLVTEASCRWGVVPRFLALP